MARSEYERLLEAARAAMRFSYSPYSKVRVGAAVLTKKGKVISGCNIENAAYGSTICAERVAIFNAISQGETEIVALAVACSSGAPCPPCGACRQVIYELAKGAKIVMERNGGKLVIKGITELFPIPFRAEQL